jgi:hypothetical protein
MSLHRRATPVPSYRPGGTRGPLGTGYPPHIESRPDEIRVYCLQPVAASAVPIEAACPPFEAELARFGEHDRALATQTRTTRSDPFPEGPHPRPSMCDGHHSEFPWME